MKKPFQNLSYMPTGYMINYEIYNSRVALALYENQFSRGFEKGSYKTILEPFWYMFNSYT